MNYDVTPKSRENMQNLVGSFGGGQKVKSQHSSSGKTLAIWVGVGLTLGLLWLLLRNKTAGAETAQYECAFCEQRFPSLPTLAEDDAFMLHMIDHLREHYGENGNPGWIPEDVNSDGTVNVADMIVIGQHWGQVETISLGGDPEIFKVVFST